MNILHIDTGKEMRGGQWQVLYLLRGLTEQGHEARLRAPEGSPLLQAAVAQKLNARPLGWMELWRGASDADLVHAHDARAHTLAVLTSKPAVVSRRVAFAVGRSAASRWKYGRAAHFIAVSECVRQTLIDAGIDRGRITVVYDGVPVHDLERSGERSGVVALDLDDPGKGRRTIEQAAALAGVAVQFSKNLVRDLPRAALFVYITELEGLGSAALLAMANGTPVLASGVGGLPEIIEDGVNGLLTSNEPKAVAHAMRRMLDDRPFAARLAARGRARVEKDFTIDRLIKETVSVYERIVR